MNAKLQLALAASLIASACDIEALVDQGSGPASGSGNTIVVDTLSDGSDPGACSLRDAIRSANEAAAFGACQPGQPGQDTIVFGVSGDIVLSEGAIAITGDLIIAGPGASELTIDGNQTAAVFEIEGGDLGQANDVLITDLTVSNAGLPNLVGTGAIHAQGVDNLVLERVHLVDNPWSGLFVDFRPSTVTLRDSVISGNQRIGIYSLAGEPFLIEGATVSGNAGGGIYCACDLRIIGSSISGNGAGLITEDGGVFVFEGNLLIHDSLVSDNSTSSVGGGVNFHGFNLDIQRSTISGNQSDFAGGGAFIQVFSQGLIADSVIHGNQAGSDGGGMMLRQFGGSGSAPSLRIVNTTISSNLAQRGGGLAVHQQALHLAHLEHVTIVDNSASHPSLSLGGGISFRTNTGQIRLFNSIVANNQAADSHGADVVAWTSAVANPQLPSDVETDQTLELDYSLVTDADGFSPLGTGNLFDADPLLGALADNGGPTLSHHPTSASPVLNAGNPAFAPPPDHDQRGPGFPRVLGGRVDMGAIEGDFDRLFQDGFEVLIPQM